MLLVLMCLAKKECFNYQITKLPNYQITKLPTEEGKQFAMFIKMKYGSLIW
jgi:hypothetical protein